MTPIELVNSTPLHLITGNMLAACKCGQDAYSRIPLGCLWLLVDGVAARRAFSGNPVAEAVCLRWQCRGLDADKAVMRTRYEFETGAAIVERRRAFAEFMASRDLL